MLDLKEDWSEDLKVRVLGQAWAPDRSERQVERTWWIFPLVILILASAGSGAYIYQKSKKQGSGAGDSSTP